MTYAEFLKLLEPHREEKFAEFQRKLILSPKVKILGVRTPTLRKLAKEVAGYADDIFSFSDEYYETTFIKLTIASKLPYEKFVSRLDDCVALIDNWALCDSFKTECIKKNKERFLPVLERIFGEGKEFYERYVLVNLLSYYCEECYLELIEKYLKRANTRRYYVKMGAAWLFAEVLVKHYERGVLWLKERIVDDETHDKAVQKARESFRLTKEQKEYLNSLKIRKNKNCR